MKVIVTSWMFPNEWENKCDHRPKSIERISSSVEDLRGFLKDYYPEKNQCIFKKTLLHLQVMGTSDEQLFSDSDDITRFYNGDGFKYLEECLKDDSLGQCVAKIFREGWEQHATYLLFQVRNLH
jgi:hypothetical protein